MGDVLGEFPYLWRPLVAALRHCSWLQLFDLILLIKFIITARNIQVNKQFDRTDQIFNQLLFLTVY